MTEFETLLSVLVEGEVILIGRFAATVHGSVRFTVDLDVVYHRSPANIERLVEAIAPFHPYLRGAPPGSPFRFDVPTVRRGLNFTLVTDLGELDVLAEIPGGDFSSLLPFTESTPISNRTCLVLHLEKLIEVKRKAGRPKDLETIAELEVLLEEKDQP